MSDLSICPCDTFVHPSTIVNPAALNVIRYRAGDYATFRHALLLSLPNETELVDWRPTARGDLALQMMEWFAYLADILTFYNERIANQSYLRTADLPESVKRLIGILGYRPRPGIGATGVVAALLNRPTAFTLPAGFQIQSKPGPGKQPQIFEVDVATPVAAPDAVAADLAPDAALARRDADGDDTVLLRGSITSINPGDELLVLEKGWSGTDARYAVATVKQVSQEKDPRGSINTRVAFTSKIGLPGAQAKDYRLLRSAQSAHPWQYPTGTTDVIAASQIDLDAITRQIKVGDPILLDVAAGIDARRIVSQRPAAAPQVGPARRTSITTTLLTRAYRVLVSVTSYTEAIWFANPPSPFNPTKAPPQPTPPIPIPHTRVGFRPTLTRDLDGSRARVLVRYGWQDVGELIGTPATTFAGTPTSLVAVSPATFPAGSNLPVLVEDATGAGVSARGTVGSSPASSIQLTNLPDPPVPLTPPLRVLFDLLPVSRGKTVTSEVLGSGDAGVAGQEFVIQNSPVTYLLSGDTSSGGSYKSTLQVWVGGIKWTEVPSFYGQPPDARVYVTREDESGKTHVQFGDGVNGARLPTGAGNVVASYRYGSGADAPAAGSLTVVLRPQPNLKAIRNPVTVGGGADPEPPKQIKRYAPRSVLTFGRAVSADDYEAIAAQAPGVARARAYWSWDGDQQRAIVAVYVGDDASATHAARVALAGAGDPNRPVVVKSATPVPIALTLTLRVDPTYIPSDVVAAATARLLDDDAGLFGVNVVRIGQWVYDSEIDAACLAIPGVLAVHALAFAVDAGSGFVVDAGFRHDPGEGGFFQLASGDLSVSSEVANVSS